MRGKPLILIETGGRSDAEIAKQLKAAAAKLEQAVRAIDEENKVTTPPEDPRTPAGL